MLPQSAAIRPNYNQLFGDIDDNDGGRGRGSGGGERNAQRVGE